MEELPAPMKITPSPALLTTLSGLNEASGDQNRQQKLKAFRDAAEGRQQAAGGQAPGNAAQPASRISVPERISGAGDGQNRRPVERQFQREALGSRVSAAPGLGRLVDINV